MPKPSHAKLLAAAAREHLRPIGLKQRGQSRLWFKDNRWWLALVEFQPSSWSQGSYLNVAAMWLWNAKEYWSFDYGGRHGGFRTCENEQQFVAASDEIARQARDEVLSLQRLFETEASTSQVLSKNITLSLWSSYHAFASTLAIRDLHAAAEHLSSLMAYPAEHTWIAELQQRACRIHEGAIAAKDSRSLISAEVHRARELLKLPSIPEVALWSAP